MTEPVYARACISAIVGIASTALAKASERAGELQLLELSDQLLQERIHLEYLRRDVLKASDKPSTPPQSEHLPF